MFVFLSKILPLLLYPLGLACLLLLAALLRRLDGRRLRLALIVTLLLLFLGGNRWVGYGLLRSLEWRHLPPAELPAAQAIVILGGGMRGDDWPRPTVEINEAGDRVLYGAWLYRQGKAPLVLVSGGGIEWLSASTNEALDMAALLEFLGVPQEALLLESQSRNTYENALFTREMLEPRDIGTILLVTSAFHMPRSLRLYQQQGFDVIPAPTDFQVASKDWQALTRLDLRTQLLNLLPQAEYLTMTTTALKEYVGMVIYALRGWL